MKEDLFGKCPYLTTQKLLKGKWSIYILYMISQETLRFNEMQRRFPEKITHTSLSRQLKMLEEEGLVDRKEYNQVPPKVEYSLTEVGKGIIPVLKALAIWGQEYIAQLITSEQK